MIVLDHNIGEDQAELLRRWRIHFKQIGVDVGRPEWDDFQEIRRYLHRQKQERFLRATSTSICHNFVTRITP